MPDQRDPEDQLRGIVKIALDRHREDSYLGDTAGAADSVLAALADEIPDGYDDLLRCLAEREPTVTVVSGDMAVELPGPPDKVVDLMAALEQSVAAAKEARSRRTQPDSDDDRYRVTVYGSEVEGTAHPSMPDPPHPGDVWVEWDDDERGWYDADTLERIP